MKALLTALASVSLLATILAPSPVDAQSRGGRGGGYHGGGHGGGGYHGGGYRGGGYGGHYRGGYGPGYGGHYHGGYGHGYGGYWGAGYWGGVGPGLALGAAYSYPYGYGAYPSYYYAYPSYYEAPPVFIERSETIYRDRQDRPPAYDEDADARDSAPSPACGAWAWNAADDRYDWVPCAGVSQAPRTPSQAPNNSPATPGWRPPSEPRSNPDPF